MADPAGPWKAAAESLERLAEHEHSKGDEARARLIRGLLLALRSCWQIANPPSPL